MASRADVRPSPKEAWNAAAPGWDAGYAWYARNIEQLTEWFCRSVATPGARVLDIACGSGQPALALAERVGASGRVVATDIAPAMVAVTRRRAKEAALDNVDVLEMDAAELRFGERSFDAVTCACGLMFCPEPESVVREIRRVLVPRGRFAIAVWDEPPRNPFFTTVAGAIGSVLPASPPDPNAPGPFRLGFRGELQRVLRAGGIEELTIEPLAMAFELGSVDEYWRTFTGFAPGVAERLAGLSEDDRRRVHEALREGCEPFMKDGRLRMTATALCAQGRTP
jgi:SAM-dependent methyltransferase